MHRRSYSLWSPVLGEWHFCLFGHLKAYFTSFGLPHFVITLFIVKRGGQSRGLTAVSSCGSFGSHGDRRVYWPGGRGRGALFRLPVQA